MTTITLLWMTTACVTPPEGLPKVEGIEQEDIPIPKSFELRASWSPDDRALIHKFRTWHGEYVGTGRVGDIVPWYVTEMQKHQWRFKGLSEPESGQKTLYFEKGAEFAELMVGRELDSREGSYITTVKAHIGQLGPESFTVDENLARGSALEKEISVQPASFSAKREKPKDKSTAEDARPAVRGKQAKKESKKEPAAKPRIEDHDSEESPPRSVRGESSEDSSLDEIKKLEDATSDE